MIFFLMLLGRLELKEDNIECLLSTACLLQLSQVVEACCKFLMKQLHPSNCLGIRSFADAQGCTDLHKVAHNYTMVCCYVKYHLLYLVRKIQNVFLNIVLMFFPKKTFIIFKQECTYVPMMKNDNFKVSDLELEGNRQSLIVPCNRNGIVWYAFNKIIQKLVLIPDSQKLQTSQWANCRHLLQNNTLLNRSVEFLFSNELE